MTQKATHSLSQRINKILVRSIKLGSIVGVLMLLPNPRMWVFRYVAGAICFFGANISCAQIFLVVRNINDGEPFGIVNLIMASGAHFSMRWVSAGSPVSSCRIEFFT